jgi:para-nitrobenzyl esterase
MTRYFAQGMVLMMRAQFRRPLTALLAVGATTIAIAVAVPIALSMQTADAQHGNPGEVKTTGGWIRGVSSTNYDEYLGIPYAAPPVGARRLMPPQPPASWNGVRDAIGFGNRCVQGSGWDPGYENPTLTEDCLYLNVYVPNHVSPGGPVLAWIHGGGFTGGGGQDTDPRKYIDQTGSIYVTINYRLGALGFLYLPQLRTGDLSGAGNYGLLDQQAALRWVHENIHAFGGNPNNVTIAGQSAGGSSVCDQLSSPTAKGLFQRAIIVSGGCSMTSQSAADAASQAFVTTLGCTDAATVLACVRGKSTQVILQAQQASPGIRPAVGGSAFPLDPAIAVATGKINRVPVMNGQVHDERRLFVFQGNDYLGHPVTAESYEATVRSTYGADADKILAAYPVSAYPTPGIALATVQSDAASYTRQKLDKQFAQWVPTHAYEFAEEQTPQFYSIYRLQQAGGPAAHFDFGATHVDDLGYLWEYLGHTLPYSDDELALSDQMITFWSQFQNSGDPNAGNVPSWPRFTPSQGDWMELKACSTSEASPQPPAACSAASDNYVTDHKLALWATVLG